MPEDPSCTDDVAKEGEKGNNMQSSPDHRKRDEKPGREKRKKEKVQNVNWNRRVPKLSGLKGSKKHLAPNLFDKDRQNVRLKKLRKKKVAQSRSTSEKFLDNLDKCA